MRDTDFYQKILGIDEPWKVEEVKLDIRGRSVEVRIIARAWLIRSSANVFPPSAPSWKTRPPCRNRILTPRPFGKGLRFRPFRSNVERGRTSKLGDRLGRVLAPDFKFKPSVPHRIDQTSKLPVRVLFHFSRSNQPFFFSNVLAHPRLSVARLLPRAKRGISRRRDAGSR